MEWFAAASVKLSESAYSAWLAADINFNFEVTYINPIQAGPDPVIGDISSYSVEKPKLSAAKFFAEELFNQRKDPAGSVFRLKYNKEKSVMEFAISVKEPSGKRISKLLAAIFSVVEFKNIASCDICFVSKTEFQNVRYISELYQKNVIVMPKVTTEYFIPENIGEIYKEAAEQSALPPEKNEGIDPDILTQFKAMINERLSGGIEEILKTATEEDQIFITENSLYKTDGKNVIGKDGAIVEEADPHFFTSIGGDYAKDAKNVYYGTEKIENADPSSFTVLHWDYAKDARNAYFQGHFITELNGKDFRALRPAYGYAADNDTVYYCGKALEGSDPKSFHAVGEGRQNESLYFGSDDNQVYLEGRIIPYINPRSFGHIGKRFFKDDKHVFINATVIENCSPASVRVLNGYYIADDKDAYFIHDETVRPLLSEDVKRLKVNAFAACDGINVYYQGMKIEGADGASADIFAQNDDGYITDKNSVFYCDEKISASPGTFRSLGLGYATDGNKVFFRDSEVDGADAASFTPTSYGSAHDNFAKYSFSKRIAKAVNKKLTHLFGDYFKDDKYIYYKNLPIPGADNNSFQGVSFENEEDADSNTKSAAENAYAKDARRVYYEGKPIDGVDPASFTLMEYKNEKETEAFEAAQLDIYAKDNTKVYYSSAPVIGAEPADFKPYPGIEDVWASETDLFYKGKKIAYIDFPTFENVEYGFYKDSGGVYYGIDPIEGLFPENLTVLSANYIMDEMFFCYVEKIPGGSIIKNLFEADGNSFDLIEFNPAFAFDRYGLFFRGSRIENIDINEISYLGDNYLKDTNGIFCGNIFLPYASPDDFSLMGSGYATDGKSVYYQDSLLDTSKPVHVLGSGYATDGSVFWLYGKEIEKPQEDPFLRETLGVIL